MTIDFNQIREIHTGERRISAVWKNGELLWSETPTRGTLVYIPNKNYVGEAIDVVFDDNAGQEAIDVVFDDNAGQEAIDVVFDDNSGQTDRGQVFIYSSLYESL